MKIGILTFHSQLNYGGVLQCWALQTALEKMGHEVVVVDRWHNVDNSLLERGYNKWNWLQWAKFWIRSLFGLGDINPWLRVKRTKKFIKQYLHCTSYHFVDWKGAPENLGVQMLVVGSDQVWHCGDWGDPRVYLLEGAPRMPAIAYAASFGMTEMPHCLSKDDHELEALPIYRNGLARFQSISCREAEGVELCRLIGFDATHVVDPTLLLDAEMWRRMVKTIVAAHDHRLVCYLLGEDYKLVLPALQNFANALNCRVDLFVDQGDGDLLPVPNSSAKLLGWLARQERHFGGKVRVYDSAGPVEFVSALANARWVLSDSFHALMFSCIFGKNVRMLSPVKDERKKMFSRVKEIAAHVDGPIIAHSVPDALDSFAKGERVDFNYAWIGNFRRESEMWLQRNIEYALSRKSRLDEQPIVDS